MTKKKPAKIDVGYIVLKDDVKNPVDAVKGLPEIFTLTFFEKLASRIGKKSLKNHLHDEINFKSDIIRKTLEGFVMGCHGL